MPTYLEIQARKIVARGGQITLPYDIGDAQVTFPSRRALVADIVALCNKSVSDATEEH